MPCGKSRTTARMITPTSARQYSVCRASASCSHVSRAAPARPKTRVIAVSALAFTRARSARLVTYGEKRKSLEEGLERLRRSLPPAVLEAIGGEED